MAGPVPGIKLPHIPGRLLGARLIPNPDPDPSPDSPGAYGTLEIGGKRYQVFHYRGNKQMGHNDAEWAQIADEVKRLLEPNIDSTLGCEIDISSRGVSYLSADADGKVTRNPIIGPRDKLVVQLMSSIANKGAPVGRPDRNTVHGSYSQGTSPYGRGLGGAACTGIDLQFAEMALLGAPIDRNLIDEAVMRGQMKIKHRRLLRMPDNRQMDVAARLRANEQAHLQMDAAGRAAVEAYFAFDGDDIRLPVYHPGLCQAAMPLVSPLGIVSPLGNGLIPEQTAEEFYRTKLSQLLDPAVSGVPEAIPVVFAGFTNGGNSIGVLVYRNPQNPREASKVVYFDSHAHPLNNSVACAKTFDSQNAVQDAARFLSRRMPHTQELPGQPAELAGPNALQITPFHLHPFFYAQTDAERARLYDNLAADQNTPYLAPAIAYAAAPPLPQGQGNERPEARVARGQAAIAQAQDKGAFLREHATPSRIRDFLHQCDMLNWPFPPGA